MCNLSPGDNYHFLLEGGISSLQAYQVLRNCGSELLYEKPESRVELAHHFWDQFMEIGEYSILNCTVLFMHEKGIYIYLVCGRKYLFLHTDTSLKLTG